MDNIKTIKSFDEFKSLVNEIRERRACTIGMGLPYRQEYYRGQSDASWPVNPGLVRGLKTVEQVKNAEKVIMDSFIRLVQERKQTAKIFTHEKPIAFQNDWVWLSQAQHLGIPTRLMDWSLHPEVALYFAIENEKMDNVPAQFLVLYVPQRLIKQDREQVKIHYKDLDETWFLNPSFFWHENYKNITPEVRRARQHGKFSIQPYELSLTGFDKQPLMQPWDNDYNALIMEKYIIPPENKAAIRKKILEEGWSGDFLYVRQDGDLNKIIDEVKEEHKRLIAAVK